MPLRIGNTAITKVYLGATEIDKVYLGSTEIYTSGGVQPPPDPPAEALTVSFSIGRGTLIEATGWWSVSAGSSVLTANVGGTATGPITYLWAVNGATRSFDAGGVPFTNTANTASPTITWSQNIRSRFGTTRSNLRLDVTRGGHTATTLSLIHI